MSLVSGPLECPEGLVGPGCPVMENQRDAVLGPGDPDVEAPPVRQDDGYEGEIGHCGHPVTRAEDAGGLSGTY
jgi:hypothetical protein